ncbi:hypothetical protein AURDEDRAFT_169448 [Auricularia subglabra TFB-10046 SS5]|nr:hypothetical protein AURDEDRAFT_169448 [Auricularia subglabra TFB-10046 SS5]
MRSTSTGHTTRLPTVPADSEDMVWCDVKILSTGEQIGVMFTVASCCISLVAVLSVFARVVYKAILSRRRNGRRNHVLLTHLDIYLMSLLLSDALQAVGGIAGLQWIHDGAAITVHTFSVIVLGWTPPHNPKIPIAVVAVCWAYRVVLLAVAKATESREASLFGPTPYWCWFSERYKYARIPMTYLWFWISTVLSIFLYVPVYLRVRGNLHVEGRYTWRLTPRRDDIPLRIDSRFNPVQQSRKMLLYPIVYTVLIVPMSVLRWIVNFRPGKHVAAPLYFLVVSIFYLGNARQAEARRVRAGILEEKDPAEGLTPLAAAAVSGWPEVVNLLLRQGAKADALSRAGETPLLLVARDGAKNRARFVQLLLTKMPPRSVDATSPGNKTTPLMHAVLKKDVETVRQLRKAGASLSVRNDADLTAEGMAKASGDMAVVRALNPDVEPAGLAKLASVVLSFLLFVVAWVNKTANGIVRRLYGLNPEFSENINDEVNDGETPNNDQFVENIGEFVSANPVLERFFKGKPDYIRELAKKATELQNDTTTPLGSPKLLPKTVQVTLHQQVVYCGEDLVLAGQAARTNVPADDSSSMRRESLLSHFGIIPFEL